MYKLIHLQSIQDSRGSLVVSKNIPFEIKRTFVVSDVPQHEVRGKHAHYSLQEVLIPVKGSFVVELYSPFHKASLKMSDSTKGVLLYPFMWRVIKHYSKDAICLSLCSQEFDEQDYIKSWDDYKKHYKRIKDDYLLASE